MFKDIKNSELWENVEKISNGWSNDSKYLITTNDSKLLLRIADISQYDVKKKEYEIIEKYSKLGFPMSEPIDFGTCNNGEKVYNVNHAQLIFTIHDTWQLSNQLLRRDEIWFVEKDANGVSTLYSLADFVDEDGVRIRKDESYERNYLIGKYDAIPILKVLDIFKGDLEGTLK